MENILIGNGFNIEIGGSEFSNESIIQRVHKNIFTKDYSKQITAEITAGELKAIIDMVENQVFQDTLLGRYDNMCVTDDEKRNLDRVKANYSFGDTIGMEDYFLLLRLYHHKYNDQQEIIKGSFFAFKYLFLDAIYDEGKIQELYRNLTDRRFRELKRTLNHYDNIFTVNYDWNLEKISAKEVKHLHGQFDKLDSQFISGTVFERVRSGIFRLENPVDSSNKHLYSNTIMGFCGADKENIMKIFNSIESDEYPTKKISDISGTISIAGISPNNDEHIWNLIRNNTEIDKVIFYYYSDKDKEATEKSWGVSEMECRHVSEIW